METERVLFTALIGLSVLTLSLCDTDIRCSACQGPEGSDCDVKPWSVPHSVPCAGKCVTRRTLYATGRKLRTIWRGCDRTIFPTILPESYRDTCTGGNFFVECISTCNGELCNKNDTGIPSCWTCLGEWRSCAIEPPSTCTAVTPTTTTTTPRPPFQVRCIVCQGSVGDQCNTSPQLVRHIVYCNQTCATRIQLRESTENSCVQRDSTFVECTETCSHHECNRNSTGFAQCWNQDGRRNESCPIEEKASESPVMETVPPDHVVEDSVSEQIPTATEAGGDNSSSTTPVGIKRRKRIIGTKRSSRNSAIRFYMSNTVQWVYGLVLCSLVLFF